MQAKVNSYTKTYRSWFQHPMQGWLFMNWLHLYISFLQQRQIWRQLTPRLALAAFLSPILLSQWAQLRRTGPRVDNVLWKLSRDTVPIDSRAQSRSKVLDKISWLVFPFHSFHLFWIFQNWELKGSWKCFSTVLAFVLCSSCCATPLA